MTTSLIKKSLLLIALTLLGLTPDASASTPIKVWPLGDSITEGYLAYPGYRGYLYNDLVSAGYSVNMVGSLNSSGHAGGSTTGAGVPGCPDDDNDGHGGYTIDGGSGSTGIDPNLSSYLSIMGSSNIPDVVLLDIGTNDFGHNIDITNAINRLSTLIQDIASRCPNARIIVTNLTLRTDNSTTEAEIEADFNPNVQPLVNTLVGQGLHVSFLDMHSKLTASDLTDGLHPNPGGYGKMATAWLPAIEAVFPAGGTAPAAPTGLTASASGSQINLSWSASSGATSYSIYRGTTAGGESTTAIVSGLTSTSYVNTGLANGTYYYKVTASNANGASGYSNEANATVSTGGGSLPSGWTDTNVGAVGATGTSSYNSTTQVFTISGSGADIYGTVDAFNFVYQSLNGNGTIVARVASLSSDGDPAAKAGVMIRETTATGSTHMSEFISAGNSVQTLNRITTNGSGTDADGIDGPTVGYYVKMVRNGTSFTGYYSADGTTWTKTTTLTISMATSVDIGLGVCSHIAGTLITATFDHVAITSNGNSTEVTLPFSAATDLENNFWCGSNNTDVTWDAAGYVDVSYNGGSVGNTAWIYNPNITPGTGNHPGTAGSATQSTFSTVTLQADVAFDTVTGPDTDSFGFYTNINSAGTGAFVVLVSPVSSTSFDVRIGGSGTPSVSGGSTSSPAPNPSTVTFGTGYWLNTASGEGPVTSLSQPLTAGTFYTVQVVETQTTGTNTINYVVNIFTTSGTPLGSYNAASGTITGVATGYDQAGQVGIFTRDKTTTGTTHIKNLIFNP